MTYEEICEQAMNIIANSGSARSCLIEAIKKAKNFNFDEAQALVKEAEEYFKLAHEIQTSLISYEMKSEQTLALNLMMVHAQDHLTMATLQRENTKEFIEMYKVIKSIKEV